MVAMNLSVPSAAPSMEAAPPRREPGQLVANRFRIEQQLAEGGMGVVFRVCDERSGKQLALKQLRLQGAVDAETAAVARVHFEREYHTLSQLSHPCIIQVFDYGVDDGGAYYTMELLEGQDLRQRGKLPWREACPVLRDIASSLAILHSRRLLHRDVTARNVFCTAGGRSKLIDFGAMMPMGVAKHLVGTAPFVPPEALQQQALDGRSDLYALGALAYWLLTGSYAYPARSFAELKQRFGTAPATLRQYDAELPEALDQLVMGLLQLERSARPSTAAEVMERLSGIAGLPLEERAEVSKAYLVMPNLVGRDAILERLRVDLLSGRQGTGTTVLIQGIAGSGRSRALDACVLRAKLRGAYVLRSDAADGARGAYGVTRELATQLLEALPTEALAAARQQQELLAQVVPQFATPRASLTPRAVPERRHVQVALRDWFLAVARDKHVVIAVDDVERIDEPSAALLGALAHGARRRRLNLLLTTISSAPDTAALSLLRAQAHLLPLAPLDLNDTELLLRSVFGDVPHVSALAERIHFLSSGNPSSTMMLAEHLVTHGLARYEAGNWSLPAALRSDQLPESAAAALHARIDLLPEEARELAEVLALTDPQVLPLALFHELGDQRDSARTYRALEALTAAGVLELLGERYRFAQFDMAEALERRLSPERRRQLHQRLARLLDNTPLQSQVPHHLLQGGLEREAIERLRVEHAFTPYFSPQQLSLVQSAFRAAERLGLERRMRLDVLTMLMTAAGAQGKRELLLEHAAAMQEQLEQDSGLRDYRALPVDMPSEARLEEALRRANERYAATPEHERGFSTSEVDVPISRFCGACVNIAGVTQDLSVVERLPRLDPLAKHNPRLGAIQVLIDCMIDVQSGRSTSALKRAQEQIAELEQAPKSGLEPQLANAIRLGQLYMLGLFAATSGHAKARERVAELEQVPGHRGNAWRVRMVYELMHGNMEAAAECQRRSELLNLQDGGQLMLPGTTVRVVLLAHMYADDLIGVKRAAERIAELADRYPGWRPTLAVARCHYKRLQGDAAGALEELEPALRSALPGRHIDWWLVAYSHVRVLSELERNEEAAECGQRYLRTLASEALGAIDFGLGQVTADALTRIGRTQDALVMIEQYIDMHQRAGTRGLRLGLAYETRARLAIAMHDEQAVQQYTRLCAQQYKGGRHLALLNRYARLLREADAGGIALTTGLRFGADLQSSALHTQTAHTVQSRLFGCVGAAERAEAGLRVLLEASGAEQGYLFGLRDNRLHQLAPTEAEAAGPAALREWLEGYLRTELKGEVSTVIDSGMHDSEEASRFRDERGREFEPVLLHGRHEGDTVVAGVAAIHYPSAKRLTLRPGVIEALTEILIADGVVEPVAH